MELQDVAFYKEKYIKVKTVDEVRDNVNVFSGIESEVVTGASVQLTEKGELMIAGDSRMCSIPSMKSLCILLGIPDPFAKRIPFDLFRTNVNRLVREKDQIRVFSSNTNNHWVNVASSRAWQVETIPLLESIEEDLSALSLMYGEISETGVTLDFRSDLIPEVQDNLEVGSITQFGRRFTNSESGFGYPQSAFVAFRLVCKNGAIAPRSFGTVRCRSRGNQEAQIASFVNHCKEGNLNLLKFADAYKSIAQDSTLMPSNQELYRVWNGVRKILGDAILADEVLKLDTEERGELRSVVKKARVIDLSDDLDDTDDDGTPERVIEVPWFTVMNRVTTAANEVSGRSRYKLQTLGGKILGAAVNSILK